MTTILSFILLFISNELNVNPPGTIRIKNMLVDKTEIQNIHWLEYIHFKSQGLDSAERRKLLPDSSNFWYSSALYRNKPIVLISYEQALDYCTWRSKVVSEKMGKKVTYRLPTPAEWKDIAGEIIKTDLKQAEKELELSRKLAKKDSTEYILTARKDPKSRVYNMFDNVTEMTLEKGIAMGSNNHDLTDLKTNLVRTIEYNSPDSYLGFRCVAEME
jgi:formylglycine-generating enzyme required for sulfatase activity